MTEPTGFFRHVAACNRFDPGSFLPFHIAGRRIGWVRRDIEPFLRAHDRLITQLPPNTEGGSGLALSAELGDYMDRSEALHELASLLAIHYGKKLRGEIYPVVQNWGEEPLAQIDRAAVPWFGLPGFGVHLNGFVRKRDGIHLWIGERAADRIVDPGKLDNIVGGGQPLGLTLEQNLAKEAWEEAGIGPDLIAQAKPAGAITYICEWQEGLRADTLFTYDLDLPENFHPHNTDGEVAGFHLLPLPQIAEIIRTTDRFKFNCNLVVMDFLLRRGVS